VHRKRENPHKKRFVASKSKKKEEEDAHNCQPEKKYTQKKEKSRTSKRAKIHKKERFFKYILHVVFFSVDKKQKI